MPVRLQPSFAKGEISPSLYGRVDQTLYYSGLRTALNISIPTFGGAENRPGLRFIAEVKNTEEGARLVPFKFNEIDSYILEFGDKYIRFIRGDGQIAYPNGTVYEISTPYTFEQLAKLKFAQSADVITIVHPDHPVYELRRMDHTNWSLEPVSFIPTQSAPSNISAVIEYDDENDDGENDNIGNTTVDYAVTATNIENGEESEIGIGSAGPSVEHITIRQEYTRVNHTSVPANYFKNGDKVSFGDIWEDTGLRGNVYTITNVNESGNSFDLLGETYDTYIYKIYTLTPDTKVYRNFTRVLNSHNTAPKNTISWSAPPGSEYLLYSIYRLDAGTWSFIGSTDALSFLDDNIVSDSAITPPTLRDPFKDANNPGAVGYYQQRRVFGGTNLKPDTSYYSQIGRYSNFSTSSPPKASDSITATLADGKINLIKHYIYVRDLVALTEGGVWRIHSGEDGFTPTTYKAEPQSEVGCSDLIPIVFNGVVIYVRDNNQELIATEYKFESDVYVPEDPALLSHHMFQHNTIVDIAALRSPYSKLVCVLSDGTCATMSYDKDQEVNAWSRWVTEGEFKDVAVIREFGSTEDTAYFIVKRKIGGADRHYIERTITRNFKALEDCIFLDSSLSYDLPETITNVVPYEEEVRVYTLDPYIFSVGSKVEINDIIWAPKYDENYSEDPAVQKQLNNKKYLVTRISASYIAIKETEGEEPIDTEGWSTYLSGGTIRNTVSTVEGVEHLNGKIVTALADGNVIEGIEVESGSVALGGDYSRVHVGLRYVSEIETLDIEVPDRTVEGVEKNLASLGVRFRDSESVLVAAVTDAQIGPFELLITRDIRDLNPGGARLFTGVKRIHVRSGWSDHGRILVRQKDPLPMHILAITPDYTFGGGTT